MGNSAQLFLGCDEALGLGCPPFGPPAVRQQHHRVKVHMHRVQDQAKKVAHSEPNPLSANCSQGTLTKGEIMAPRHSASTSSKPIHDRIAQLELRAERGK
jgi:hypothetical protein